MRNILLTVFLCLLLCSPAVLYCAERLDISLPSWLTTEDANYLKGGITEAHVAEHLSIDGFLDKDLQTAVEDKVGNYIPCKALALLGNAAMQRESIVLSNCLFRWEAYPATYGSNYLIVPDDKRMLKEAATYDEKRIHLGESVAASLNDLAQRWPNVGVFVYLAADSAYVQDAPNAQLVSNPLNYASLRAIFDAPDVKYHWIDGETSYEEYNRLWFKSDHHWTAEGAYSAFQEISEAMGLDVQSLGDVKIIELDEPLFYGTRARRALDSDYADRLAYIWPNNLPNLEVEFRGKTGTIDDLVHAKVYQEGRYNKNKFANHYGNLFHTDVGLLRIRNLDARDEKKLVIVSDSYTNCLEYLFSPFYREVIVIDPRYYDETLDFVVSENGEIADVLFLMRPDELVSEETLDVVTE